MKSVFGERFPGIAGETAFMVRCSVRKCEDPSSSLGTGKNAGHGVLGLESQHQEGANSSSSGASSPSTLAAQASTGFRERLSRELRCRSDCGGYLKLISSLHTRMPISMVCIGSAQGVVLFGGVAFLE